MARAEAGAGLLGLLGGVGAALVARAVLVRVAARAFAEEVSAAVGRSVR